jgi:hypothetical protein
MYWVRTLYMQQPLCSYMVCTEYVPCTNKILYSNACLYKTAGHHRLETQLRKSSQGSTLIRFRMVQGECFNQRLEICSIIYCIIFSCRRSDFIVQNRIGFEMAIHISGWASVVHAENFFSPKLWFEVTFWTIMASCMLCWIDVVILLLRFLRIGGKIEMMIYFPAWVWHVHKESSAFICSIRLPYALLEW